MEISKPDYTYLWSSGGSIVAPSNTKIQTGWTAEVPPFQWENWSQNRQDQAISHILQKGISVWSSTGEYYFTTSGERSYVQGSDGNIYVAVADSVGQDPTTDATDAYWKLAFATTAQLPFRNFESFTTAGVSSWVVPVGVNKVYVRVVGGGGGGRNSSVFGGGGGGGGVAEGLIAVTPGASITVTVGAAGTGGAYDVTNGSGTSGGSSSFSGLSATGGSTGGTSGVGGTSGTGSGGTLNYGLGDGGSGGRNATGVFGQAGNGGGAGGYGNTVLASNVGAVAFRDGQAPGAGGGGRMDNGGAAGNGVAGAVYIYY